MRAYLERIDLDAGMARFYIVVVTPTLLGTWSVNREWGRMGQGGTVREEGFETEAVALESASAHVVRKQRVGYYARRDGEPLHDSPSRPQYRARGQILELTRRQAKNSHLKRRRADQDVEPNGITRG